MERSRQNTPLHTGYTTSAQDEWSWLRSNIGICPDLTSPYFRSLGSLAHYPFDPQVSNGVVPGANGYGPAVVTPNGPTIDPSKGIVFSTLDGGVQNGTANWWRSWTLAVGFKRLTWHANSATLIALYRPNINWRLKVTSAGVIIWNVNDGYLVLYTPSGVIDPGVGDQVPTQSIVVTSWFQHGTVIYVNGREVARAEWGTSLHSMQLLYIGMDYATKENVVLGGAYGPVILSRDAWAAGRVAQWAANPWGWRAPSWEPQAQIAGQLKCDVRTRFAVEADIRTRSAVEADARTRAAVEGDARTRPAVEGDTRTRPAVEGDVRTRRG
jgi:hypothetical protein